MNSVSQTTITRNGSKLPCAISQPPALDLATTTLAQRFGLSPDHARLVAQLAGLGGKEVRHG